MPVRDRRIKGQGTRLTIRHLRAEDVEACARIIAGDPLWQRYRVALPRAAGEFAIALRGRRIVGFIWFRFDGTFHHSGYVRWVGVSPDAQGRGVGRRLMRYAEERILEWGPNVFLLVSDFNRRAQTFYEAQGYTRVGAIPDYVVAGVTEYLYRKTRGPIAARRAG